jgi:hypothetical protein
MLETNCRTKQTSHAYSDCDFFPMILHFTSWIQQLPAQENMDASKANTYTSIYKICNDIFMPVPEGVENITDMLNEHDIYQLTSWLEIRHTLPL